MNNAIRFSRYTSGAGEYSNPHRSWSRADGVIIEYNGGYGCIQAWPQFGDDALELHLDALREGRPTVMGQACLNCCRIDGDARRNGVNLLSRFPLKASHYLIERVEPPDSLKPHLANLNPVVPVKIKGSPNLDATVEAVEIVCRTNRVRIDFNAGLDCSKFKEFMDKLSPQAREQIQFIEDPFPYDADQWRAVSCDLGVRLALDWGPDDALGGFAVRIWKPARQLHPPAGKVYCITHNMDHVIGRGYAAYQASVFKGDLLECGLGKLLPNTGDTGFGCDSELESMKWECLQ